MLYSLAENPRLVNELATELNIPQPIISCHLGILKERGLVSTEREGTAVRYTLGDRRIIVALDLMRAIPKTQLNANIEFLKIL